MLLLNLSPVLYIILNKSTCVQSFAVRLHHPKLQSFQNGPKYIHCGSADSRSLNPPLSAYESYNSEDNYENSDENAEEKLEDPFYVPNEENVEEPLQTISGGTSEIFSMARRMMVWNEEYNERSSPSPASSSSNLDDGNMSSSSSSSSTSSSSSSSSSSSTNGTTRPLPRWHPHEGIADSNPSFRSKPPLMNNKGYALLIRRNSRKRNKQSLWRHAYRTYNQMKSLETKQNQELLGEDGSGNGKVSSKILIARHVLHFEAALVSCAKLGLWREALSIYNDVLEIMKRQEEKGMNFNTVSYVQTVDGSAVKRRIPKVIVTDNMILSIVKACVRGSKNKDEEESRTRLQQRNAKAGSSSSSTTASESKESIYANDDFDKREPLDAARDILLAIEEKFNIPLVSRHVNPLAAAYQHIGLYKEGSDLISNTLADRKTQAQDKEEEYAASFNVNDVKAKDAASYNILIQGAITEGDWASAIGSLRDMTEKGLYPESRSLNTWSETARKRERRAGSRKTTWKKNRERLITGTIPMTKDKTQTT